MTEAKEDAERRFWSVAERFTGGSIDLRKRGSAWPAAWRARIVAAKNERAEYRVTGYGSTRAEACERALELLPADDPSRPGRAPPWAPPLGCGHAEPTAGCWHCRGAALELLPADEQRAPGGA